MRSIRCKLMVPAALLVVAALAGCSTSSNSVTTYRSENRFGAGDRFGTFLFEQQTRQNIAAANLQVQPVELTGTTATATASVGEQNAD
ncbi:MAG: hypothetical protein IT432_10380 [Phycisphaerales bacterium]|nr:hypothetical protein [Phycisphaerales bacterium]